MPQHPAQQMAPQPAPQQAPGGEGNSDILEIFQGLMELPPEEAMKFIQELVQEGLLTPEGGEALMMEYQQAMQSQGQGIPPDEGAAMAPQGLANGGPVGMDGGYGGSRQRYGYAAGGLVDPIGDANYMGVPQPINTDPEAFDVKIDDAFKAGVDAFNLSSEKTARDAEKLADAPDDYVDIQPPGYAGGGFVGSPYPDRLGYAHGGVVQRYAGGGEVTKNDSAYTQSDTSSEGMMLPADVVAYMGSEKVNKMIESTRKKMAESRQQKTGGGNGQQTHFQEGGFAGFDQNAQSSIGANFADMQANAQNFDPRGAGGVNPFQMSGAIPTNMPQPVPVNQGLAGYQRQNPIGLRGVPSPTAVYPGINDPGGGTVGPPRLPVGHTVAGPISGAANVGQGGIPSAVQRRPRSPEMIARMQERRAANMAQRDERRSANMTRRDERRTAATTRRTENMARRASKQSESASKPIDRRAKMMARRASRGV